MNKLEQRQIEILKNSDLAEILNQFSNVEELLLMLLLSGSPKDKNEFAKSWSIEACGNLISIGSYVTQNKIIKSDMIRIVLDLLTEVSEYFQCENYSENGIIECVSELFSSNIWFWSIGELLIFTYNLKKGKYKTEFQNINRRGINAEFLTDWIKKFEEERMTSKKMIDSEFEVQRSEFAFSKDISEEAKAKIAEMSDMLRKSSDRVKKLVELRSRSGKRVMSAYNRLIEELFFLCSLSSDLRNEDPDERYSHCKLIVQKLMEDWRQAAPEYYKNKEKAFFNTRARELYQEIEKRIKKIPLSSVVFPALRSYYPNKDEKFIHWMFNRFKRASSDAHFKYKNNCLDTGEKFIYPRYKFELAFAFRYAAEELGNKESEKFLDEYINLI